MTFVPRARTFLAELKRRRVIRVAAVYAVTGFVVLQAADILFPALRLPEWSMTLLVALALLGLPVALGLAWAFDLTAEGLVRTPGPDAGEGRPEAAPDPDPPWQRAADRDVPRPPAARQGAPRERAADRDVPPPAAASQGAPRERAADGDVPRPAAARQGAPRERAADGDVPRPAARPGRPPHRPATAGGAPHPASRPPVRSQRAFWLVLAVAAAASAVWFGATRLPDRARAPDLDENVVAVLPFRVAGADPSIRYLREGMVDLLTTKLTGEWGPRAVDARTLIVQWRRRAAGDEHDLPAADALALARDLGAGRLILGEVVSAPNRIVISASVANTRTSRSGAPVTVEGPPDSLTALVDRLAAGLLARDAGEPEHRLAGLLTTSLPALRAYLSAQARYRAGLFDEAADDYEQALTFDSTFALAGLGLSRSLGWTIASAAGRPQGLRLAWDHRERLSPRDRAYLEAIAGPGYPAPRTARERLEGWERVVARNPDDAEAWYELGDVFFHYPEHFGAAAARMRPAFERAVELDSSYAPALIHLVDLAADDRDADRLELLVATYLQRDSTGFWAEYARAMLWRTRGDTAAEARLRSRIQRLDVNTILGFGLPFPTISRVDALPWDEVATTAEIVLEAAARAARTGDERRDVALLQRRLALNGGRASHAALALDALRDAGADELEVLALQVEDALYWDGDIEAGARAAEALAARLGPPDAWADEAAGRPLASRALCALQQWRLAAGQAGGARTAAEALARAAELAPRQSGAAAVCAALLDAWAADVDGSPDAPAKLASLGTLLGEGPAGGRTVIQATIALARLLEAAGELDGAYRIARLEIIAPAFAAYESTSLRLRGRLAARLGDTDAAARHYGRYLTIVSDPEPGSRAADAREQVARAMTGEPPG